MLRNLEDALGKNILRDVLQLRGSAETEAEVPPGNAKRIDVWFVPDYQKLGLSPQFIDILAEMSAEPAVLEVWSGALGVSDFRAAMTKRGLFHETLELRDKRSWTCPMLWHVCAGKPETVFAEFGFLPSEFPGWYRLPNSGLRVQIIVLGELPKLRSTLLLRLLGRGKVRREALREFRALPDDAWEKPLANIWLTRLGLEVPMEPLMTAEDNEFYKDVHAWYEEHNRRLRNEVLREVEAQRAEALRQSEINQLVHLFEHRLRRQLDGAERDVLTWRVETHGSTHVADLVLDLSTTELAAWLEQGKRERHG